MSSVRSLLPEALEELRAASRNRRSSGFARRARGVLMWIAERCFSNNLRN
jgi:hypothetical protein